MAPAWLIGALELLRGLLQGLACPAHCWLVGSVFLVGTGAGSLLTLYVFRYQLFRVDLPSVVPALVCPGTGMTRVPLWTLLRPSNTFISQPAAFLELWPGLSSPPLIPSLPLILVTLLLGVLQLLRLAQPTELAALRGQGTEDFLDYSCHPCPEATLRAAAARLRCPSSCISHLHCFQELWATCPPCATDSGPRARCHCHGLPQKNTV